MSLLALSPPPDACRWCGEPGGVVEPRGIALHVAYREPAEVARINRAAALALSTEARADKAEICIRGVPLP